VVQPFEVRVGKIGSELDRTIENAKRDGVSVTERVAGSQSAGEIGAAQPGRKLKVVTKLKPVPEYAYVPLR